MVAEQVDQEFKVHSLVDQAAVPLTAMALAEHLVLADKGLVVEMQVVVILM